MVFGGVCIVVYDIGFALSLSLFLPLSSSLSLFVFVFLCELELERENLWPWKITCSGSEWASLCVCEIWVFFFLLLIWQPKSYLKPMRIRKRQVPFPLSSLSPVPLSDPLFNLNHPSSPSPVVQLRHYDSSLTKSESPHGLSYVHPQPSDRPNQQPSPTGGAIDGSDIPDAGGPHREEERKMKKQNRSVSWRATKNLFQYFVCVFFS